MAEGAASERAGPRSGNGEGLLGVDAAPLQEAQARLRDHGARAITVDCDGDARKLIALLKRARTMHDQFILSSGRRGIAPPHFFLF